jgi:hypothetical protein
VHAFLDWTNTGLRGAVSINGTNAGMVADLASQVPANLITVTGGALVPGSIEPLRMPISTGRAVLGAGGTVVVPNIRVTAQSNFVLTAQEGHAWVGAVFQSARVVATSFTIESTAGAADAGGTVYFQIWAPTVL